MPDLALHLKTFLFYKGYFKESIVHPGYSPLQFHMDADRRWGTALCHVYHDTAY